MKEVLVSFKYKSSYGSVNSIYIMDLTDWKKIKSLQSKNEEILLYGFAGKHSEVSVKLDNFVLVSTDEDEIESFRRLFGKTFGSYKPFDNAMELYEELSYNSEDY